MYKRQDYNALCFIIFVSKQLEIVTFHIGCSNVDLVTKSKGCRNSFTSHIAVNLRAVNFNFFQYNSSDHLLCRFISNVNDENIHSTDGMFV